MRMKRQSFLFLALTTAVLTGCGSVPSSGGQQSSSVAEIPQATIIQILAKNYEFVPNVIRVKKGDNVILRLASADTTHGVSIPEMHIDVMLRAGEPVEIPLPTDTAGTFTFICSVPCGSGHMHMTGTIIVE